MGGWRGERVPGRALGTRQEVTGDYWEPGQAWLGALAARRGGAAGGPGRAPGVVAGRGSRWRCGAGRGAAGPGGAQRGNPSKT